MRHGKTINHLGRTASHRNAMLSNMASSLILHKRISTTVAKAKALRKFVEPLLTKSKNDTTHSRRLVFAELGNKEALKELFGTVSSKVANRPGGYTRIIKLSDVRLGDNAEMCIIELVDFNETLLEAKNAGEAKAAAPATRRSRSKKKADAPAGEAVAPAAVVETAAPADTATTTVQEGETRDEAKADEEAAS
ncbi:large subunit ribosomal protein L17 [Hymenobacter luteus]|uniref:Large ribosomal subunit protein bL17 n=2 Tax=Hymenobacter TaxID=89966 RepID=A0A7W9W9I0_9BACT|nr:MULTISPECIES: 50S ribosomal protein L17 [Hymenobacter]MBB4600021.1 large subunit ribosomal protein L17 [Hymenobacter latericoloratus]MBB6057669.1 large subunit ribosomal protein L17 [Hymenobacter luteus]RPD49940.1 50S ribosomal protein L17 [Hymenobacter sediminis]